MHTATLFYPCRTHRPHGIAVYAAVFGAIVSQAAGAAPPGPGLWTEMDGPNEKETRFTVRWNNSCEPGSCPFDFYNMRWGRQGDPGLQRELSKFERSWSTTLTETGVSYVFKLQTCETPALTIGPIRPGGSTCSEWAEVVLTKPAPPADLRATDVSGWEKDKYIFRHRLGWRPGLGIISHVLRISLPGQKTTEYRLSKTASDTIVEFTPSAAYEVCGVSGTNSSTFRSVEVGCTRSIVLQKPAVPVPLRPLIEDGRDVGKLVQVSWKPGDNVTSEYEIERLHRTLGANAKAVFKGNDKPTQAPAPHIANAPRQSTLDARQLLRPDRSPAGHPLKFATGGDTTWVKILPAEMGFAPYCSPIGPLGASHMSPRCMKDDPMKYPEGRLGPPVEPYQYRVCAVNAGGRTCSEFVAVVPLRPSEGKVVTSPSFRAPSTSSTKVQAPLVPGQANSANLQSSALGIHSASGQSRIQVSPGTAVDAQGQPIAPTAKAETRPMAAVKAPVATAPGKLTAPAINAKGNEVSIERLELSDGKISSQGGTPQSGETRLIPSAAPKLPPTPVASARTPAAVQPALRTVLADRTMKLAVSRIEPGYRHFNAPNAQQCQARCSGEAQYKAWTWVRQDATCHLRNEVPKVVNRSDCCVSGVKQ